MRHRSTILYTEYEGVYLLEQDAFRDGCVHYHPECIKGTINGLLFQLLGEGNRLQITGPHRAVIAQDCRVIQELRMPDLCVMVFA